MKVYVCANCGAQLDVKYKSLPNLGKIVRLVPFHECGELVDLATYDLAPLQPPVEGKDEFVQNLNELHPERSAPVVEEIEPGDRRDSEHTKSSAPPGLADSLGVPDNLPEEDESGRQDPTGFPGLEGDSEENEE